MIISQTRDMKGICHAWRGQSLWNIIVYSFEKIEIFEVILNENERRWRRSTKLVSVKKEKLL